jgi:hypothetical protein
LGSWEVLENQEVAQVACEWLVSSSHCGLDVGESVALIISAAEKFLRLTDLMMSRLGGLILSYHLAGGVGAAAGSAFSDRLPVELADTRRYR